MLTDLTAILEKFQCLETHKNFFIRERIYRGTKGIPAISNLHKIIYEVNLELQNSPLSEEFLLEHEDKVKKVFGNLNTSLDLLIDLDTSSLRKDNIDRYYSILEMEITDIKELITSEKSFDPSLIPTSDMIEQATREDFFLKIEDNIAQILTCFEWRRLQEQSRATGRRNQVLDIRRAGLQTSSELMKSVTDLEFLQLLSIIFMKARSKAASNLDILDSYIPFLHTICRLFSFPPEAPFNVEFEDKIITSQDIKADVERKVNTGKLDWIVKLHESVLEEVIEEDLLQIFAERLYSLNRDRRKEFLWSMSRIAREERNSEIEDLSIKFANLSTALISMVYDLKSKGYESLSKDIKELADISAIDAVSDMAEIYQFGTPNIDHMITALKKQIEKQKEFAFKILGIEELSSEFIKIMKFTDMDYAFSENTDIEEYLKSL